MLRKDGETVRMGFHGARTLKGAEPVDAQTIYRIYSMTKPVTAVAMLMLYEEGRFSLDDPVTKFLPELNDLQVVKSYGAMDGAGVHPAARPPTMRELMTHTAGFGYNNGVPNYTNRQFEARRVAEARTNEEYLNRLAGVPLMYEPGTGWAYSAASDLQGIIIERLTGERLGDFMKRRIFDPLGMVDTGFHVTDAQRPRLAAFTAWTPGQPMQEITGPLATMEPNLIPRDAGGHGLVSTLADYERFAEMLLHEGTLGDAVLLKPESVALLRANALTFTDPETGLPKYGPRSGAGFGFGVAVVADTIRSGLGAPAGTYYWDGAAGTWFWIDPRDNIVFVGMLQNFSDNPVIARPMTMRNVYHALYSDYDPTAAGTRPETPN